MESLNRFTAGLQRIFSLKRTKITLYIATVLWLSVATQVLVNRVFFKDFQFAEAFVKSSTEDIECSLEIAAQHPNDFLSESEKKDILKYIADEIGLRMEKDIAINRDNDRIVYAYEKQAKKASTVLKIVSLEEKTDSAVEMKNYIIVRLKIKESIKSLEKYRKLLENVFKNLGIEEKQVTVQYEGYISKNMTADEKEDMARSLIKELQGEIAFDYWQENSYTVYAYTGLIDEYIESAGCKINIQIAMTYDEQTEKTKIYLATPIINQDW